jgi:hypothetical protein
MHQTFLVIIVFVVVIIGPAIAINIGHGRPWSG